MVFNQKLKQEEIEEDRREHQKHQQMQNEGQNMQRRQLQDLLQNPQVIDRLVKPDTEGADPHMEAIVSEHLHVDQVLSIYEDDDLWRKGWKNKIWAGKIEMSFPFEEARTDNRRVNEIQKRIHGHDKRPLQTDERRKINALMEQKTDREKRGSDGEFVELLLSQVVKSEERNDDSNNSGGLLGLGGD